jgi:hypothetical protein
MDQVSFAALNDRQAAEVAPSPFLVTPGLDPASRFFF